MSESIDVTSDRIEKTDDILVQLTRAVADLVCMVKFKDNYGDMHYKSREDGSIIPYEEALEGDVAAVEAWIKRAAQVHIWRQSEGKPVEPFDGDHHAAEKAHASYVIGVSPVKTCVKFHAHEDRGES